MDRTRAGLLSFLRTYKLAVEATVSRDGAPQSAVIGFAVSDALEIVFDTLTTSRKFQNLRHDPRIALVIGWDHETTAQIEGLADVPSGVELERLRKCYFAVHPDGRSRLSWPDLVHVRVRPNWVRHSDFTVEPPCILEFDPNVLA